MHRPTFCRICFDRAQQLAPTRSDEEHVGHTASLLLQNHLTSAQTSKGSTEVMGWFYTLFLVLDIPWFPYAPAPFPSAAALLRASRGDKDFPVLLQLFDVGVGALIKTQRLPQMLRMCHGPGKAPRGAVGTPNPSFVTQSCSPGVSPHVALLKNQL